MPTYLIDKIRRHGLAIDRLMIDLKGEAGEFRDIPVTNAVAFDAADFVWATIVSLGVADAQESRAIRNHVAESIIDVLRRHGIPDKLDKDRDS